MNNFEIKFIFARNGVIVEWAIPYGWQRGSDVYSTFEAAIARAETLRKENDRLADLSKNGASYEELAKMEVTP